MTKINWHKEADGWRAYIKSGKKIIVIDGAFEDESGE